MDKRKMASFKNRMIRNESWKDDRMVYDYLHNTKPLNTMLTQTKPKTNLNAR